MQIYQPDFQYNLSEICNIFFVFYAYEAHEILVRPMKNRGDESFVQAYKEIYEYLGTKGFKPTLNVTDNECSKVV